MSTEGLTEGVLVGGDFRIVRPLNQGGMGAVYVAQQLSTATLRALKTMHPQLANDAKLRRRFEQEAKVGARIESDHVVSVIAAGVDDALHIPWLAMELLDGEDLGDHVGREGRVAPQNAAAIFAQLGHALVAAHAVGVVHRDLKPDNVFLARPRRAGDRYTVKVLDFGIAKVLADVQNAFGTGAIGTPLWMSPEQASPGAPVTHAADLWSVGLIAFFALTGVYYWRTANAEDATITALMREITVDPLDAASARAAELGCAERIPPGFDAWFARCVDRDPLRRFARTADAFEALRRVLEGTPPRAMSVTQTADVSAPAPALAPAMARAPVPPPAPARVIASTTAASAIPVAPPPRRRLLLTVSLLLAGAAAVAVPVFLRLHHATRETPVFPAHSSSATSAAPSVSVSASASAVAPKLAPADVVALSPMKEIGDGTATIGAALDDHSAADNEKPLHKRMVKAFFLDVTEVTVEAYARCVADGACTPATSDASCNAGRADRATHPINCVSAVQAEAYCAWMGKRLPEEWEWEWAAEGPEIRRFPWGSDWPDETRACFNRCAKGLQTCTVGSFARGDTRNGLKDLAGNVWEWTSTPYCPYSDPECDAGDHRVIRGGGWCGGDPSALRTSSRQWMSEHETRSANVGFRCARTL